MIIKAHAQQPQCTFPPTNRPNDQIHKYMCMLIKFIKLIADNLCINYCHIFSVLFFFSSLLFV